MSLGPMELIIILGIALLLFGPSRLPGLGRSMGDAIRGFKKGIEGQDEKEAPPARQEQISGVETETPASQKTEEKDKTKV